MRTAEFILLAVANHIDIIGRELHAPVPWWFRFKLHNLTEQVDYGCEFNDQGVCQGRDYSNKGCCSGCRRSIGYHNVLPGVGVEWEHREVLSILAESYSKQTGFYRPGKGCILPREMRSSTCVKFKCRPLVKPFDKWLIFAISDIGNFFKQFQDYMFKTHECMITERDAGNKYILEYLDVYIPMKEAEEKLEERKHRHRSHDQLSLFKEARFMGKGSIMP